MVFFDQNAVAGEWRAQMRCCEEQGIAVHRSIAFALAVAELLELPDALPLMPAVTAVMPCTRLPRRSCKPRLPEGRGARRCWQ